MPPDETPSRERFLVELDPASADCDPGLLTQRARQAETPSEEGASIRHVRTIYVPEDASSYLLIEASSAAEIEHALRTVGLETRSVDPAMQAGVAEPWRQEER